MELRHLRYFVAVAEELHFNRAAERLHIRQPPLSTQIKQLENEIGVRLLDRTTRSVSLTDAGTIFLNRAREILALAESSGEAARQAAAGLSGTVRVGFSGTATFSLLPVVAAIMREKLPRVAIEAHGDMLSSPMVEALEAGVIDACFGRLPFAVPTLESHEVRSERLSVILPSTHPLAARSSVRLVDLRHDPFVVPSGRESSAIYNAVLNACRDAGFTPLIAHEASQTATMVSFVAAGFGVALAPETVNHLNLGGVVHVALKPATVAPHLQLLWARSNASPILDAFLQTMGEHLEILLR